MKPSPITRLKYCLLILLLQGIARSPLPAQNAPVQSGGLSVLPELPRDIRLSPLPYWTNLQGQEFSPEQLFEASLAASGLEPSQAAGYRQKFAAVRDAWKNEASRQELTGDPYALGGALLKWLHENHLRRYNLYQTRTDTLLDNGAYNCVSSGLFYYLLARDSGLSVQGFATEDHFFCRVETPAGWVDVETTSPHGFDPGKDKDFERDLLEMDLPYDARSRGGGLRRTSQRDILALILQNRIAALQRGGRHLEAPGLALDRWTLADTPKNREDFVMSVSNAASYLNRHNRPLEAMAVLREGRRLAGPDGALEAMLYPLAHNHLVDLFNSGSLQGAGAFLRDLEPLLDEEHRTALRKHLARLEIDLIRNRAVDISRRSGWKAAWDFLEDLPEEEKNLPEIRELLGRMKHNWTAEIHNRYAAQVNRRNFPEARRILDEGLALDPENPVLLEDREHLRALAE